MSPNFPESQETWPEASRIPTHPEWNGEVRPVYAFICICMCMFVCVCGKYVNECVWGLCTSKVYTKVYSKVCSKVFIAKFIHFLHTHSYITEPRTEAHSRLHYPLLCVYQTYAVSKHTHTHTLSLTHTWAQHRGAQPSTPPTSMPSTRQRRRWRWLTRFWVDCKSRFASMECWLHSLCQVHVPAACVLCVYACVCMHVWHVPAAWSVCMYLSVCVCMQRGSYKYCWITIWM